MKEQSNKNRVLVALMAGIAYSTFLSGCTSIQQMPLGQMTFEQKQKEQITKFGNPPAKGYQPIDPISISITPEISESNRETMNKLLLNLLPNETVRLVIGKEDSSGNITFGPFTATAKIGSYVVILDYIKYRSSYLPIVVIEGIAKTLQTRLDAEVNSGLLKKEDYENRYSEMLAEYLDSTPYWVRPYSIDFPKEAPSGMIGTSEYMPYSIPVYIGIGVRMIASVTVSNVEIDLGSLYGLAAAAQNGKLQGTLVVQTLGLSGENISPQIPLPSDINITTVQNAIQSLATIKSKIYDQKVTLTPEIVAIDDGLGRTGSKEQIISGLNAKSSSFHLEIPVSTSTNQ